MPLVTIPLRLFGKSLKEYNFSVFTLPATDNGPNIAPVNNVLT